MRQIVSIFLAVSLIITAMLSSTTVLAKSTEDELKSVIKKSKTLLDIGEEYENFDYSVSKSEGTRIYNLNWRNKAETEFISVSIDSSEFIMSYDKSSIDDQYEKRIPKVSEKEGAEIAKGFIKKVNPEISKNIEYKGREFFNDIYTNRYYFTFVRVVDGVKYEGNTASVQIDNKTKEVKSFNTMWDKKLVFPKKDGIISLKQAEEIYKEKIKFDLLYKYDYTGENKTPHLVYSFIDPNKSVSAKDGRVLNYTNNFYYRGEGQMESSSVAEDAELSEEEIKEVTTAKKLVSEDEAEKIARKFANIKDTYELTYASLYKQNEVYTWFLDFTLQEKNTYYSKQVVINAKSKEVVSFNDYSDYGTGDEFKYSKDEALKLAKTYLNDAQPKKVKEVEYVDINPVDYVEDAFYYTFNFTRKVNGILFEGDGFTVGVDKRNGNIVSYTYNWYDKQLEKPGKVVTREEAYDTLLKQAKLELQYIKNPKDLMENNRNTELAYVISDKDKMDIDAKTGKIVSLYRYGNEDIDKPEYTDIDKSFARKEINALLDFNIYLPGNEFKPKSKMTQRDFLYLLLKTKDDYVRYDDVDELYKALRTQGIVKKGEESPKSQVTREEAVKYIIRALKFQRVAEIKGIYKLDFKDKRKVDKSLIGHIAIAKGLNIVGVTKKGEMKPKQKLTREQGVILIYNLLNTDI